MQMSQPIEPNEKRAKDFSPAEYEAKLAELKRGAPPQPAVTLPEKHARDMSDQEKSEWLSAHKKRFR
jgi:hypothetical protein